MLFWPNLPFLLRARMLNASPSSLAHGRGHGHRDGHSRGWGNPHDMDDDGGGPMRGRKFSADELQVMLLALLEQQPRHGYELIKALQALSNGFYSPSPGVVYPALSYLEDIGYTSVRTHGTRKQYSLTEAGRIYLDAQRERAERMFASLRHVARKMAWVRHAWRHGGETDEEMFAATGWLREFVEARRALKEALGRHSDATAAQQHRIAAILRRATKEIQEGEGDTTNTQEPQ